VAHDPRLGSRRGVAVSSSRIARVVPGLVAAGLAWFALPASVRAADVPADSVVYVNGLEALRPEAARAPFAIAPGVRSFRNALSVSPGYGVLGRDRLFVLRAAYHPASWLGYEATLAHDPGHSVHAVLHSFGLLVRWPLAGRLQPYGAAGYGMVMVEPGPSLNAKPVTKNALTGGAGLEWFIRDDLSLRSEVRQAAVFGEQRGQQGVVVYDYTQATIGLAFYRSIRP
jgi:opacity protein-like surface antigen